MIRYLIPDLPTADDLLPFLREIDQNRQYTNFGPLWSRFQASMQARFFPDLPAEAVVPVSNGSAAIEVILRALRIRPGARVLMPCFTFPATATAVISANAQPLLADIDPSTWRLTPAIAWDVLRHYRFDAVVPVAVLGTSVESEEWQEFSRDTGIPVIVDAAPALGNQTVVDGVYYAFSLHATKPFGFGEGGLVVANDVEFCNRVRSISNFGFSKALVTQDLGTNAKLSEFHCAAGLAQLARYDLLRERRLAVYQLYKEAFARHIGFRHQATDDKQLPANLYLHLGDADAGQVRQCLMEQGVESRRLYWPPLHEQPGLRDRIVSLPKGYTFGDWLGQGGLAIPFHHFLTQQEVDQVLETLVRVVKADGINF